MKYTRLVLHYRRSLRHLWLTAVVSLLTASSAYPWDSKGHQIVAAVAETHLNNTVRKRIKELLPQGTTLADASTWPDKGGCQIPDMAPYHYINFPKDANTYDQQRDCKLRNCIIEAIAWYMQVLKSPDAPRNEKRTALRFVAHLVGDIHQPLHAGFAEDRGGRRDFDDIPCLKITEAVVITFDAVFRLNPRSVSSLLRPASVELKSI